MRVIGLSSRELSDLRASGFDADRWHALLLVTVDANDVAPVAGRYVATDAALEFHPHFPFDPGRAYRVRVDPGRLPGGRADHTISTVVSLPRHERAPSTVVTAVYPSAGVLPENVLRLYLQFSSPMAEGATVGLVRLLDDAGRAMSDVFLPFETGLWSGDRTRYTVFFDPGRVKRGILPNRQMGRALKPGRRYTIEVSETWRDAEGAPLTAGYRREFRAGPAATQPLSLDTWRIAPPSAGSRDPVAVTFPSPLDHGLLQRAIGIATTAGQPVSGDVLIDHAETRWRFTPAGSWRAGAYQLIVLSILEDPAGNQIGRAFEVGPSPASDAPPRPERLTLPFTIR